MYFIYNQGGKKFTILSSSIEQIICKILKLMLERTGKRRGGGGEDERNCNEDAAGEKRAESKRNSTGQRLKGKEKTFIEREPRPYPALLFTGLPGAPELEVARFVSVPLPRRSIGNNYPVCNRRPPR